MNKIYLILFVLLANAFIAEAQTTPNLWGTTTYGGANNCGTLYSYGAGNGAPAIHHSFKGNVFRPNDWSNILEYELDKLIIVESEGEGAPYGQIGKVDVNSGKYSFIYLCDPRKPDIANPEGGFIKTSTNRYLCTSKKGIIEFFPQSETVELAARFSDYIYLPKGRLFEASDRNIYGVCYKGVYKYNVSRDSFSLMEFPIPSTDLRGGFDKLTEINGELFGTFKKRGLNEVVVFKLNILTEDISIVAEIDAKYAGISNGVQAGVNQKLYVVLEFGSSGQGGILEIDPITGAQYEKRSFHSVLGGVIFPGHSFLSSGGLLFASYKYGIFSYDPVIDTVKIIAGFDHEIYNFVGQLTEGSRGTFYGYSISSIPGSTGEIYQCKNELIRSVIVFGNDTIEGRSPQMGMVEQNGILYGTTLSGGKFNLGTLYSFNIDSDIYTEIHSFNVSSDLFFSGINEWSSLFKSRRGNIYIFLTDEIGGKPALIEYNPISDSLRKLFVLEHLGSGYMVKGVPIEYEDDKFVALSMKDGMGEIFEFDLNTGSYNTKYNMDSVGGISPSGSLTIGEGYVYYGATMYGGNNNNGVIFSYNPFTGEYVKIIDIPYEEIGEIHPIGDIVYYDGNIYGHYSNHFYSGVYYLGYFKYSLATGEFKIISRINDGYGSSGSQRQGAPGLFRASNNKFYSLVWEQWINNLGRIYEIDPLTDSVRIAFEFGGVDGSIPIYNQLIEYGTTLASGISEPLKPAALQVFPNPAKDHLRFVSNLELSGANIRIYNLLGQELMMDKGRAGFESAINVASLPSGNYLLKIEKNGEQVNSIFAKE